MILQGSKGRLMKGLVNSILQAKRSQWTPSQPAMNSSGSCIGDMAGSQDRLVIFLLKPSEYWDSRCAIPRSTHCSFSINKYNQRCNLAFGSHMHLVSHGPKMGAKLIVVPWHKQQEILSYNNGAGNGQAGFKRYLRPRIHQTWVVEMKREWLERRKGEGELWGSLFGLPMDYGATDWVKESKMEEMFSEQQFEFYAKKSLRYPLNTHVEMPTWKWGWNSLRTKLHDHKPPIDDYFTTKICYYSYSLNTIKAA
jgi:hypothetical protein